MYVYVNMGVYNTNSYQTAWSLHSAYVNVELCFVKSVSRYNGLYALASDNEYLFNSVVSWRTR